MCIRDRYAIVQKLKRAYEDILRLQFPENEKALFEKVKSDISVLGEWLCIIREIGSLVASGSDIERDNFEKKFELNCDSSELKDSSLHFSYYNHFHEVESILDNIEDDFEQFKRCLLYTSPYSQGNNPPKIIAFSLESAIGCVKSYSTQKPS